MSSSFLSVLIQRQAGKYGDRVALRYRDYKTCLLYTSMLEVADVLEALDDFSLENQEAVVMNWLEDKGYHLGNIMNAFRLTDVYKRQACSFSFIIICPEQLQIGHEAEQEDSYI